MALEICAHEITSGQCGFTNYPNNALKKGSVVDTTVTKFKLKVGTELVGGQLGFPSTLIAA
jgi:hypothetical protein